MTRELSRRSYLRSASTVAASAPVLGGKDDGCGDECEFCRSVVDEPEAALSGTPDFSITSSAKTHQVYWRPQDHFKQKFAPWTIAYAAVDGNYVVLNEGLKSRINATIVAHEIGHNLGYEHTDGTLMAATVTRMDDRAPDTELTEITRNVFGRMTDAVVCDWTSQTGRDEVLTLIERHVEGDLPRSAALYGLRRYVTEAPADAYVLPSWGNTEHDIAQNGLFYRG